MIDSDAACQTQVLLGFTITFLIYNIICRYTFLNPLLTPFTYTLIVGGVCSQYMVQCSLPLPLAMDEEEERWESAVEVPHDGGVCGGIEVIMLGLLKLSRVLIEKVTTTCSHTHNRPKE